MSSFYDDASLIMYPSGYKEDKIYSLKPTNGTGDLTFSRASSATRVNEQGLIDTPSVLGSELVTNGDFATDTGWNKNANWSINTTLNVAEADGTTNGDMNQSTWFPSALTTYIVSYEVVSISQGSFTVRLGNSYGTTRNSIGTYADYITTSDTDRIRLRSLSNFIGSIDNVSVKEVITSNIPRIDYSNGCGSLLLEPQRTNLVNYSESFDNAYWTKNGSSVTSGFTSPDGTTNAFKLVEDTSTGAHQVYVTPAAANADYSISVFAKKGERDKFRINIGNDTHYADFNLTSGTIITQSGATTFAKIDLISNGWYRCSISYTESTGAPTYNLYRLLDNSGNASFIGDGTSGIYIYGAQLELGSYATSYIPTSGTTVTRLADSIPTKDITSFAIGNSYTILIDAELQIEDNNKVFFTAKTSVNQDSFTLRNFGGLLRLYNNIDSAYPVGAISSSTNKFVLRIDGTSYKIFGYNTSLSSTFTTSRNFGKFNVEATVTKLKMQNLQIFSSALTDAECIALTT